jgi:hypothetical protein
MKKIFRIIFWILSENEEDLLDSENEENVNSDQEKVNSDQDPASTITFL